MESSRASSLISSGSDTDVNVELNIVQRAEATAGAKGSSNSPSA